MIKLKKIIKETYNEIKSSDVQKIKTDMNKIIDKNHSVLDLQYVDDVYIERDSLIIQVPYRTYSLGKDIKFVLNKLGIKTSGKMNKYSAGDYQRYEFFLRK
jgi:hypothetical protein